MGGKYFTVGYEKLNTRAMPALRYQEEPDVFGWQYDSGWYFYQEGQPVTGWFTWCGVRYYFEQSGRAVTGWETVDEQLYFFSATGAMVKNSTLKQGKTTYQLDHLGVATKVKK